MNLAQARELRDLIKQEQPHLAVDGPFRRSQPGIRFAFTVEVRVVGTAEVTEFWSVTEYRQWKLKQQPNYTEIEKRVGDSEPTNLAEVYGVSPEALRAVERDRIGFNPEIRDWFAAKEAWAAYRTSMSLDSNTSVWKALPRAEKDHWVKVAVAVKKAYSPEARWPKYGDSLLPPCE